MWGEGGGQTGREGMRNRVKGKKGGVWGDFQEERGGITCMCIFACGAMVEGVRKWEGRDKKRKWGMAGGVGGEEGDKGSIKICYDHLQKVNFFNNQPFNATFQYYTSTVFYRQVYFCPAESHPTSSYVQHNGLLCIVLRGDLMVLTQCGQLHLPSGAFSMSGSRQTM